MIYSNREFVQIWRLRSEAIYNLLVDAALTWNLATSHQQPISAKVLPYRRVLRTSGDSIQLLEKVKESNPFINYDVLEHPSVGVWHGVVAEKGRETISLELDLLALPEEESYYNRPVLRIPQLSNAPVLCFGDRRQKLGSPGTAYIKDTLWYNGLVEILSRAEWWASFLPLYHRYLEASYGPQQRQLSEQALIPLLGMRAWDDRRRVIIRAIMGAVLTRGPHHRRPCSFAGEMHLAIPLEGSWNCGLKNRADSARLGIGPGSIVFIGNTLYRHRSMSEFLTPTKRSEGGLLTVVMRRLTTDDALGLFVPTLSYIGAKVRQPNLRPFKRPRNAQLKLLYSHDLTSDAAIDAAVSQYDYTGLEAEMLRRIYDMTAQAPRKRSPKIKGSPATFMVNNCPEHHSTDFFKYVTSRARLLNLASDGRQDGDQNGLATTCKETFTIYRVVFQRSTPQATYEPLLVICELPRFTQVGLGVFTVKAFVIPYIGRTRISDAQLAPENTHNVLTCARRTVPWWEDTLQVAEVNYEERCYVLFNSRPSAAACYSPSFEYINCYEGIASRPNCAVDEFGGLYTITGVQAFTELTIEYWSRYSTEVDGDLPRLSGAIPSQYDEVDYEFMRTPSTQPMQVEE